MRRGKFLERWLPVGSRQRACYDIRPERWTTLRIDATTPPISRIGGSVSVTTMPDDPVGKVSGILQLDAHRLPNQDRLVRCRKSQERVVAVRVGGFSTLFLTLFGKGSTPGWTKCGGIWRSRRSVSGVSAPRKPPRPGAPQTSESSRLSALSASEQRLRTIERQVRVEQSPLASTVKARRNERCPCRSGLKYKHCHRLAGRHT